MNWLIVEITQGVANANTSRLEYKNPTFHWDNMYFFDNDYKYRNVFIDIQLHFLIYSLN